MNTSWRFFDMPCHDKAAQCLFQLFVVELSMSHNICHGYWHVSYDMFHIPYNPCNVIWHMSWGMTLSYDRSCHMWHDMSNVTWHEHMSCDMTYDIWYMPCLMTYNMSNDSKWHMSCEMTYDMSNEMIYGFLEIQTRVTTL